MFLCKAQVDENGLVCIIVFIKTTKALKKIKIFFQRLFLAENDQVDQENKLHANERRGGLL